ncbi:LysR family transcriptional regulator [Streptomyces hainanensis]|uniref:LysR family transcriptional regulator n=1 Tax=Streptomyces hainanensis TaxID=402648 RepID=A0A4R4TG36_9ACTN|nr:LysR family transcriptional regulator [Streptomyces hainanensis]TDC76678.1 LysR family transcriptional regulator [Streptomyces hainanensis]
MSGTNVGITHLRAFLAVLDQGGFGSAAEELGVSQSAVSHAVATLERLLGAAVLVRGDGRPRPTALGERILPFARRTVDAHAALCALAAGHDPRPSGTVRLAATATACLGVLPALLARWKADFPGVKVVLLEGDDDEVEEWLRAGAAELAVLVGREPPPGVPVASDTFQALLRRDHPLAGEAAIELADLDDDPLVLSTGGCEPYVEEVHRLSGVMLRPAHRVRDMGTLLTMVRGGIGVAIMPGLTATLLDHRLVLVPLTRTVTRHLSLTGPADRPWHPLAELLTTAVPAGARAHSDSTAPSIA